MPGLRLDVYELVRPLGTGGMGEVWLATDVRLGRTVAVKLLPPDLTGDPTRLLRFEQEARTASALNHPNVCTIFSLGDTPEGHRYLAMEHVAGESLRQRLSTSRLTGREAVEIAIQIAAGLGAAHGAGIIHRDVKPENVMLRPDGLVKVLDFGLAKLTTVPVTNTESQTRAGTPALTESGVVMGTVAYMSPEQARAEPVDARTDLFSLGAVLYEMLTGRRAFPRPYDWTPPPAAGVPAALQPIVFKLLAADVTARYGSASDVLRDLRRVERARRPGIRGRRTWFAAGAVLLGLVALIMARRLASDRPRTVGPGEWVKVTNLPDSATQPALSPDGRMLAFIRGPDTFVTPGEIYVKALPDGEPVQLTRDGLNKMSPAFSPDGLRIAYTVSKGRSWDTWMVPVINGQPYRWLANATGLVWSGTHRILFSEVKDGEIHLGVVAADEQRANAHDVYVPANARSGMTHRAYPSPDGQWVLVAEMEGSLWLPCRLVPMSGISPGRQVGPPGAGCTSAAWSPDGTWMFFTANANGAFHVWRQRFPDGPPDQVTSGVTEEEGVVFEPNGRSFLTSVGQRQSVVWLHDRSGERAVSLEGYSYDVKLTPDGTRLCYRVLKGTMPLSDPSELRLVELETERQESLLPGVALAGPVGRTYDVSPNGHWVVASALDTNGRSQIWLASLDRESPPRQIPGLTGDRVLFAGDAAIVFRRSTSPVAFRAALDGSGVARVSGDIKAIVGVSPHGDWVLVREVGNAVTAIPSGGGASRPLIVGALGAEVHVAWGRGRLFVSLPASAGTMVSGLRGRTYVVPLAAGQVFPPTPEGGFSSEAQIAATPGATVIDSYDAAPGPTRDTYAYSRQSVLRNIYRIPIP